MFKKLLPIYSLLFVNSIGFSLLIPVLPFIVHEYGASDIIYGVLISIYSFLQFLTSPFLGSLSDRFGRKPVLIISQGGTLLAWVLIGLAYFLDSGLLLGLALPLWVIGFARVLDGLTAGNSSVAMAYLSDVVEPKERAKYFSISGAIGGISFIFGPVIGGLTASSQYGYGLTALVAAVISTIALALIFNLKETVDKKHHEDFHFLKSLQKLNVFKGFWQYRDNLAIVELFTTKFVFFLAFSAYVSIIVLFMRDVFHFDEAQTGFYMLVVGSLLFINQSFLGRKIIAKFGDYHAFMTGLLVVVAGMIGMYLASFGGVFVAYFASFVMTLGLSLVFPTVTSLAMKQAGEDKKGEIAGLLESLGSLASAIMPLIAASIYFYLDGASFVLFAGLVLMAFILGFRLKKHIKNS